MNIIKHAVNLMAWFCKIDDHCACTRGDWPGGANRVNHGWERESQACVVRRNRASWEVWSLQLWSHRTCLHHHPVHSSGIKLFLAIFISSHSEANYNATRYLAKELWAAADLPLSRRWWHQRSSDRVGVLPLGKVRKVHTDISAIVI